MAHRTPSAADAFGLGFQHNEHRLRDVFGQLSVPHASQGRREDEVRVTPDDQRKGPLVAPLRVTPQKRPVVSHQKQTTINVRPAGKDTKKKRTQTTNKNTRTVSD